MAARNTNAISRHLACSATRTPRFPQTLFRCLHDTRSPATVPAPTPFVPDVPTFLSLIGRSLSAHASKIASWDALFRLSSAQLKELGVEPARSRRYLLMWRERFRKGRFGIGGDLQHVVDGVAEIRVVEVPRKTADGAPEIDEATGLQKTKRVLINVPPGGSTEEALESVDKGEQPTGVVGVKLQKMGTIAGPYFNHVKGTGRTAATIKAQEGMWEFKRGVKIHGGERRRKNVLSKIAARARGTLK